MCQMHKNLQKNLSHLLRKQLIETLLKLMIIDGRAEHIRMQYITKLWPGKKTSLRVILCTHLGLIRESQYPDNLQLPEMGEDYCKIFKEWPTHQARKPLCSAF